MPASSAAEPPDAALAARARAGDERAFGQLVGRHQRPVFALCCRYLGPVDGADAAQESFVRAFTGLDRFDGTRPLLPWLLAIARRACLDQLRARRHERAYPDGGVAAELSAVSPGSLERHVSAREELGLLAEAFGKLAEGPREALALFHFHELSYKEIAEQLEIPMGTVMTWIHRGRDALRTALGAAAPQPARARRSGE